MTYLRAQVGPCGLRCYVDTTNNVYAKCTAEECQAAPAFRLGRLSVESDVYLSGSIRVDMPFLQRGVCAAFDGAVQRWTDGGAKVLSVKSIMGSGKSTFLDSLLADMVSKQPDMTVLVVTYRQSLASEHSRKVIRALQPNGAPLPVQPSRPRTVVRMPQLLGNVAERLWRS